MNRIFVAIPLPESVVDQILELESNMIGARWVPVENLHLTLAFIGEVANDLLRAIVDSLDDIEFQEFDICLKGVGFFGAKAKPRVLWCGVEECKELVLIQKKVVSHLRKAGVKLDRRKFVPHITLAKLSRASYEDVGAFVEQYSLFKSPPFKVSQFSVYHSRQTSRGSEYTVEQSFLLEE